MDKADDITTSGAINIILILTSKPVNLYNLGAEFHW